jgi:hypothetical protein
MQLEKVSKEDLLLMMPNEENILKNTKILISSELDAFSRVFND